ncbi:lipid A deacylase LpxR family protein [Haloferula sp. A504]|uniref:lipid A deacylase LpxR family protein n=1 Tax=Haloferula sp. A504 TaxID=3373601 RepID=UPI0031C77B5E|nr:lipid A deacylase LpxR family protein [Verrucomicrobiaceae bacterium E54]
MKALTLTALLTALLPLRLPASPLDQEGYLTFQLDNDLFGGSDRGYTNGARLSWISGSRDVDSLRGLHAWLRRLSGDPESFRVFQAVTGFEDPDSIVYNHGFSLTQLMFTPADPLPYAQPPLQRRYAGWLGLGISLHAKTDRILNSVEFAVGTTGENSFAEVTQDFVHSATGTRKFNGWDAQVPSEITFDLSFIQKRRLDLLQRRYGPIHVDGIGEWGVRLGTFRTAAHLGGMLRVGYNLPPDFSDPRLSPTSYSHRYFGSAIGYESDWSLFLILGAEIRGVAHDATLDGPVFRDFDTGIERRPWVGEVYCGAGVRYRAVELGYAHTWRTEEYRTQRGPAQLGTVTVRWRF